jgi:ketopantoate reductase
MKTSGYVWQMKPSMDTVVLGLGQLGQLFGAGALRAGNRVTPLLRDAPREAALDALPDGVPIWVTVGEKDLPAAVQGLPAHRRLDAILVQNELFPANWEGMGLSSPTVAVVWISKKKGRPVEVGGPTQVFGPHAEHVAEVHRALDLPVDRLSTPGALAQAIVDKYAFILTINALGVVENLKLGAWLDKDAQRVAAIALEAARLGAALVGEEVDQEKARAAVEMGMKALSHYPARGRTAAARVERAQQDARRLDLELPALALLGVQKAAETGSPE